MIAAMAYKKDRKKILVLGLCEKNIEQMKAGRPAVGEMPDESGDFLILYGKTEMDIMKELKKAGVKMPEVMKIRGKSGRG